MKILISSLNSKDEYTINKIYKCIDCNNCIVWCNIKDTLQDILQSLENSNSLEISTDTSELEQLYNLLDRLKCMVNSSTNNTFYSKINLVISINILENADKTSVKEKEVNDLIFKKLENLKFNSALVNYKKQ